ncbi:MAG: lamin tail domain-containing protein, partial [Sedimentisphaerales bacterium]|nr:lamin tail domain-containing protein [Sedimentisphaerales bacterium]
MSGNSRTTGRTTARRVLAALATALWLATAAPAELTHRYSFNGNLNDSIAGADGTLINHTALAHYADGQLILGNNGSQNSNGTTGDYVDLPNGIISANGNQATFEFWLTWGGPSYSNWQEFMSFGTSDGGENSSSSGANSTYIMFTPQSGASGNRLRFGYRYGPTANERVLDHTETMPLDQPKHVAVTWDGSAGVVILYVDGQPIQPGAIHFDLSEMLDNNNWLGRSQWPDPLFVGSYNEFRIYDHAMNAEEVLASYLAGPDMVSAGPASNPDPQDDAVDVPLNVTLGWDPSDDPNLLHHIVYLGTDQAAVAAATPQTPGIYQDTLVASQVEYTPASLQLYTDYYWRIDEVNDQDETITGAVWHFRTVNLRASDPGPPDHAVGISTRIELSWTAPDEAEGFDVYLGTNSRALELVAADHPDSHFAPGPLAYATPYCWRIDTLYPDDSVQTGAVWTFTTRDKPEPCLLGDLDGDCDVDTNDLYLFVQQWPADVDCSGFDCPDLDQDGQLTLLDFSLLAANWLRSQTPPVVINEIHYHPDENTEPVEFIELYNPGLKEVFLDGWYFSDGIAFTFPAATRLGPDQYVVVAQDPDAVQAKFGVAALGPFTGKLANEGERVMLRDAAGTIVDQVEYQDRFPWPVAAGGDGSSLELIHPALDNDLGGSWRSSGFVNALDIPATYLVAAASAEWHYFKGEVEPSDPMSAWREVAFVENADWLAGQTGIGYGDGDDNTILSDMQGYYTSVYLRHEFVVPDIGAIPETLELRVYVDDGCVVWINGKEVRRFHVDEGDLEHDDTAQDHEAAWESHVIANPGTYLQQGTNVLAIHALNRTADSTDFSIDACLYAPGMESGFVPAAPTPGAINSNWSAQSPPAIRQVQHRPQEPSAGTDTVISAKVTDPQGVAAVTLYYQVVRPGQYIPSHLPVSIATLQTEPDTPPLPNPDYTNPDNWTPLAMVDDGLGADAHAGDGVYTAVIGGQDHRVLVRYRIRVEDGDGQAVLVPYEDDPALNFAYFVYDGVPDYQGVPAGVLEALPVYHLITRGEDMHQVLGFDYADQIPQYYNGTYNPARFVENWWGTLVYEGQVYDHIRYRLRGANGRYLGGNTKRSMRLRFNRGRYFQAKDEFGNPYPQPWQMLTTAKGFDNRLTLTYALNERINFFLFNVLGVPSPETHYFHFRVIDGAAEAPDPWRGDFWGLNFAQETYDARFLEAHDLAEGNLYKLINSTTDAGKQQRYQGPHAVTDGSDHDNIEYNLTGYKSAQYILDHVRVDKWYVYHALCQAIRHYDYWPSANKNAAWYFEPDYTPANSYLGKMWTLPFDTDATWGPTWNNGHDVVYNSIFVSYEGGGDAGSTPELQPGYYNAVREVLDLLWQPDQVEPLVDYYADQIADFVEADRIRWLGAPSDAGNYDGLGGAGKAGLANLVQDMKNFAFVGGSWPGGSVGTGGRKAFLQDLADGTDGGYIPYTPSINYYGAAGYPLNDLLFVSSPFSDLQGSGTFAAIKWRLAQITDDAHPVAPLGEPRCYELQAVWESDEMTVFQSSIIIPGSVVKAGHTYRVRVRMKDTSGRWSHWSNPIQFRAGPPKAHPLRSNLRVTEIMYHPAAAAAGGYDREDYEFIELQNTGATQTLDLSSVMFTEGIQFEFTQGVASSLPPGGFVLIVKNRDAFRSRYGTGLDAKIAGEYTGQLDNGGEQIMLADYYQGPLQDFAYDDWYEITDGSGFSLTIRDAASDDPNDWSAESGWRASFAAGGSPGQDDSGFVLPADAIRVNELLAHSDTLEPTDWVEFYNTTDDPIHIGGWFISDNDGDLMKYRIEENAILAGHGYAVFRADPNFGAGSADPGSLTPFALSENGEIVYLTSGSGGQLTGVYSTQRRFGASEPDVAFGHYVKSTGGDDFVAMRMNTPGGQNDIPRVGPVVINEIAYNPASDGDAEFVEFVNVSGAAVTLYDADKAARWRFVDNADDATPALEYFFPASPPVTLAAGGYFLLVKDRSVFESVFLGGNDISTLGVPWAQWTAGSLSNGGEMTELQIPGEPGNYIRLDRVNY